MKLLLAILLPLFIVSCAGPDAGKRMRAVMPPMEKPSMELRVIEVEDTSRKVQSSNRELQRRVVDLKATASEASSAAAQAESEVARLVEQKQASETELFNLSAIMKDVAQRNMFLESSVIELKDKIIEQEELLVKQSLAVSAARAAAAEKDQENEVLRGDLAEANERIIEADKLIQKHSSRAQKEAEKAASAKTYRNIFIALGIAALLYVLVPVVIRSLKPVPL